METRSVREILPLERFRVRAGGRLRRGPGVIPFDGRSRYYFCPRCAVRTLIHYRRLDIFNPPVSPFPANLLKRFGRPPAPPAAALDFACRGCGAPVRLLFEGQERGMGGWWYGYVTSILELE